MTIADLLTHAFVGYTIGVILSWRYERLNSPHITAIMVGSTLPDLIRIRLLIDPIKIEKFIGLPFSWTPIHVATGALLIVGMGSLVSSPKESKIIFALLAIGTISHLFLDSLLITASGYSYAIFWPFLEAHPTTPTLYLSTDVWPVFASGSIAVIVKKIDRIK